MKIELTFGNKKQVVENVYTYKTSKSLVSGLLIMDVVYNSRKTERFNNVYSYRVL